MSSWEIVLALLFNSFANVVVVALVWRNSLRLARIEGELWRINGRATKG